MLIIGLFAIAVVVGLFLVGTSLAVAVGQIILALAGVFALGATFMGCFYWLKYPNNRSSRSIGATLISAVLAVLLLVSNAAPAWATVSTSVSDWWASIHAETLEEPEGPEEEEPQGSIFVGVDMDAGKLQRWVTENIPSMTWDEMKNGFDDSSLYEYETMRKDAVKAAGANFSDPVSVPFKRIEDLKKVGKITPEELAQLLSESKEEVYIKIATDPLFADMVARCLNEWNVISQQNEWFRERIEKNNAIFANTAIEERGINGFLWQINGTEQIVIRDDVFEDNIRLCVLLDMFDWERVEARTSVKNWCMPTTKLNRDIRMVEASYQESRLAIVLNYYYKDKEGQDTDRVAWSMGFNAYDKRAEIFDVSATKPTETKPNGTGDPGTKPGPKTYSISIIGYEYGTDHKTVVLKEYTPTEYTGLKDGASRTIDAPSVKGYTIHKGYESVEVTIDGTNGQAVFYYDKVNEKPYTVTVQHLDRSTGKPIYEGSTQTYYNYADKEYFKVYPRKNAGDYGYQLCSDQPSYKDGNIKGKNVTVVFEYEKKATDYFSLSYQRGYYAYGSGKWVALDADPIYVGSYRKDQEYSFTVKDPSQFNTSETHYVLQGSSRYKDTMPGKNYVIYVICDVQHKLDISYKKVVSGQGSVKVFEPYIEWIKEGGRFRIWAPELDGYYATPDPVEGRIETTGYSITVFYYKNGEKADGEGAKRPETDPVNTERDDGSGKSNAEVGGGNNLSSDGSGDHQKTEPPLKNYDGSDGGKDSSSTPTGGSNGNNSSGNGGSSDTTTVTKGDDKTSGETGNKNQEDKNVVADDGGKTHGGTAPDKSEIPVKNDTTATTVTPNENGGSDIVTDQPNDSDTGGLLAEPD